jgi:hypothetical protein
LQAPYPLQQIDRRFQATRVAVNPQELPLRVGSYGSLGNYEMNRNGGQETRHRLVANQYCNHCEHDGTCESREVAKLAGTEYEAGISLKSLMSCST